MPRIHWIGRPIKRREDERFLRGRGRYIDDLTLPGMLHMVVVRSSQAHAKLRRIRTDEAMAIPGVVAIVTAQDLIGKVRSMPLRAEEGMTIADIPHPLLATDKVRYTGEPVAAVLAQTRAAALDAAATIEVDYDPLPEVVDVSDALNGTTLVHEAVGENVVVRWEHTGGDVDGAFSRADRVVNGKFRIPRLVAVPIETRGVVASYDRETDLLTVWCSAQDPYRPRTHLSHVLNRSQDRIRVIVQDVGGAFGTKGSLAPEQALAAFLAVSTERPVKWVEDRRENFLAAYQGRGVEADVQMAVTRDGKILAVKGRIVGDLGAYLYAPTASRPIITAMLLTGAYEIPSAQVDAVGLTTNKVPIGPYRGAGRPEAAYIVERMLDLVARELALDPVEVRRGNLIPSNRFPYKTPTGLVYDSGNYERALDRALELLDYDGWKVRQREARAAGRLLGIGVAVYVERAAPAVWERTDVRVDPDGLVRVRPGSSSHGQGHETIFAQIAADNLQLDLDAVTVEFGDTARMPEGVGTFGSRSTTLGGSALILALDEVRAKAIKIAAHLLEAAEGDIELTEGHFAVRGTIGRSVSFDDVAAASYRLENLPSGMDPGLEASGEFRMPDPVFPFGAYAAVVEVEHETGQVMIHRFVAVDDAGRIINPLLAEGQVIGATVQGLGQALVEEAVYDDSGQMLTGSLTEYGILHAPQVPEVHSELLETRSPLNPLGAKGIGEAGTIGAPPAIVNAVVDALEPFGVRHIDVPLRPEKIWRLIRSARTPEVGDHQRD
ncbi:MAG TPA: xanthine dehydrogenase family protein molybdopterin-binding subunit [bacterium]|nr:xanthine dehydrogenase family protein molybdopterin-binding subunit [bacterium]